MGRTSDITIEEIDRFLRINTTTSVVVARDSIKHCENQPERPSYLQKINFAIIFSFRGDAKCVPYPASKGDA
ncbi:hypothetical protein P168DRAFT_307178, partial [Aspergillus campestris IBT 28561]